LRVSENKQVHFSEGSEAVLVGIGQYCTVLSVAVIAITLPWKILIAGIGKQTSPFQQRKRGSPGCYSPVLHGTISCGDRHRSAVENSDCGYRKTNKSISAKEVRQFWLASVSTARYYQLQ